MKAALTQLRYLLADVRRVVRQRPARWISCWLAPGTLVVVSYRLDRAGFLLCGRLWAGLRLLAYPGFLFLRLLGGNHEIHYAAEIGSGLQVLHPSLGIVIIGKAIIGDRFTATGGNCIGTGHAFERGQLVIGNGVVLGVNAVILGPVRLGHKTIVGAGAVVTRDFDGNGILVGVPAKPVTHRATPPAG